MMYSCVSATTEENSTRTACGSSEMMVSVVRLSTDAWSSVTEASSRLESSLWQPPGGNRSLWYHSWSPCPNSIVALRDGHYSEMILNGAANSCTDLWRACVGLASRARQRLGCIWDTWKASPPCDGGRVALESLSLWILSCSTDTRKVSRHHASSDGPAMHSGDERDTCWQLN